MLESSSLQDRDGVLGSMANHIGLNICQDPRLLVSLSIHMGLKAHRTPHVMDVLAEVIKKSLEELDSSCPVAKLEGPARRAALVRKEARP